MTSPLEHVSRGHYGDVLLHDDDSDGAPRYLVYYHILSKWPCPMFVPLDRCLLFLLDVTFAFPVVF